jgi:hypothetical protein
MAEISAIIGGLQKVVIVVDTYMYGKEASDICRETLAFPMWLL